MEYNLKCQLCGKQIFVNPKCPCALGEHLLQHHPDVEFTFFSCEEDDDSKTSCKCKSNSKKKVSKSSSRMCISSKSRISSSPKKKCIFKTTVETWKSGPVKIVCPKCKKYDRPCIRKQRNKVAHSSLGAFFMLSCWPICFLPFFMPKGSSVDLFCKHCSTFLGEYNRTTGTLKCACNKRDKKVYDPLNICSEFD